MNFIRIATTLLVAAACASCTSGGTLMPTSTGRYLQFRHPVSSVVAFQMTFPTSEGCAGMLNTQRAKPESRELLPFVACVSTTASASLPARATIRNKTYAFLVDVEAVSVSECNAFVDAMMNSDGKDNLEVAAPCAPR